MAFVTFSAKDASHIPKTNINLGPGAYNHNNKQTQRKKDKNIC